MKRILTSVLSGIIALSVLATASAATPHKLQIKISALNGSGERGTAILTQMPKGVLVIVNLAGNTAAQPTHIHAGNCGHINASPEWPLNNTIHGTSKTLVPGVTLAQMLASPYAINIHKSLTDLKDYVACGNIRS